MSTAIGTVETRLRELEARLLEQQESSLRRRGHVRRATRVAVLLVLLIAAPVALASDRFSDVPTGNSFHNQINLIAQAGITKGCNPPANTLYCPADPVRRDQMAAFLNRAVGRTAIDKFAAPPVTPGTVFASVQVRAEGDALVVATATSWFETRPGSDPVFPCYGAAYLALDGTALTDVAGAMGFGDYTAPGVSQYELDQAAAQNAWVVAAGNHTVNLVFFGLDSGSCDINVGAGSLTATVVPFGGTGGAPFAEPGTAPGAPEPAAGTRIFPRD